MNEGFGKGIIRPKGDQLVEGRLGVEHHRPELAAHLDFSFDWDAPEADLRVQASQLLDRYAQRASVFILDKVRDVARKRGTELIVALFDPVRALPQLHQGAERHDQEVVDYLQASGTEVFDMNEVHLRDLADHRLGLDDYLERFLVGRHGHYNPRGNHFFAYSLKGAVVRLLEREADGANDTEDDLGRELPLPLDLLAQRPSLEELEHKVEAAVLGKAEVVDRDDVWMTQTAVRPRLAIQAGEEQLPLIAGSRLDGLEGDNTIPAPDARLRRGKSIHHPAHRRREEGADPDRPDLMLVAEKIGDGLSVGDHRDVPVDPLAVDAERYGLPL